MDLVILVSDRVEHTSSITSVGKLFTLPFQFTWAEINISGLFLY